MDPTFAVALSLVIVGGTGLTVMLTAGRRRAGLRARLSAFAAEQPADEAISLRRPPAAARFQFLPAALMRRLEAEFAATGRRINLPLLTAIFILVAVLATVFAVVALSASLPVSLALGLTAGLMASAWLLHEAQRRYQRQLVEAFPEALDVMVRSVRAGLSVLDAMNLAGEESPAPVGPELRRTLDEMRIGVDIDQALQHAADRIRVSDFSFFVVGLTLQRRTGGALAETLANLSALLRRRSEIRTRTRALIAESKASMIVLSALPLAVTGLLFFVSHDRMTALLVDPRGRFLLGMAAVLVVAGILTMVGLVRRIVR